MDTLDWKDTSSYSRRDTEKVPRTFRCMAGGLEIIVTRHSHFPPDVWVLTCGSWFSQRPISKGTADEAKAAALSAVRQKLQAALSAMGGA